MASEVTDARSSTTILSEDELLGHSTRLSFDHDLDEEALLGGDDPAQDEKPPVEESTADTTFDREELDYDDDEEQEEKPERSKFTSERTKAPMTSVSASSSASATASVSNTSTSSSGYSSGRGNYNNNNNNYRRRGGFQNRQKLPSLLGMQVRPPPAGGKILVNPNFIPNQPLVRLNMPGSQTITMCPPMQPMPSAFMAGPAGPIVPRLPNGIPLVALPPNHGVAGFGQPPPAMPMRPPMLGNPGNWDQAVNAFLNPTAKRSRRRSSSRSSYSSSGSSRSRSPRRRRGGNSGRREEKRRRRSGERSHRREERRRDGGRRDYNDRSERRRGEKVSEECAKAVGVDNEYLDRIEEQKRRRDEVMKKKEQRRFGVNDEPEPSKNQKEKVVDGKGEKKAHLCVVIRNMKHLPTAQQKIEKLAAEVGPITKCWRFNDDIVHLIFADHSNAKAFLVKFNGKVLSGLRMQVHVEKAYLNLAEIK